MNVLATVKQAVDAEKRQTRAQMTDEERELIQLREQVRQLLR